MRVRRWRVDWIVVGLAIFTRWVDSRELATIYVVLNSGLIL